MLARARPAVLQLRQRCVFWSRCGLYNSLFTVVLAVLLDLLDALDSLLARPPCFSHPCGFMWPRTTPSHNTATGYKSGFSLAWKSTLRKEWDV